MEEGTSETALMASVGTSGPPFSKVGREGFLSETARDAKASMAQGPVLFRILVVRVIRARGVLPSLTHSSYSA